MAQAVFLQDAVITTLVEQLSALPCSQDEIVLLLVGEHSAFDIHELVKALQEKKIRFAGGVFTGVIFGNQKHDAGIIATVLPTIAQPSMITGLDGKSFRIDDIPDDLPPEKQYTAVVLVDGLTNNIALFLERLFRKLASSVRYIGGGAGSLSFEQKPCVFDNTGIYQDAALILWLKSSTQLGVRHGWQHLHGPLTVTKTSGTVVQEIDGKPAFQAYDKIIQKATGKTLTPENFFSIAKQHPLGIYHAGMDYIVRDPISFTEQGALVCVGEVPARSLIYILRGQKETLIEHAELATSDAIQNYWHGDHNLIIDCVSRALFLEDDFEEELSAAISVLPPDAAQPFGVLSLGEIATFDTGRVEFFNKTFVVGSIQHHV